VPSDTSRVAAPSAVTLWRGRAQSALGRNGAFVALLLLGAVMTALSRVFLTTQNLLNVGVQAAVVAILGFGQTFVIITSGIDLSVGSVAALSGIVVGYTSGSMGVPPLLAILLALAAGVATGLVSGVMVAFGRLPAFIATMAMLSIARGLVADPSMDGVKLKFFYGARGPRDLCGEEELKALPGFGDRIEFFPALSDPDQARAGSWTGLLGFIHEQVKAHIPADQLMDCEFYTCGPPVMINAVMLMLGGELKVPPDRIHYDSFV